MKQLLIENTFKRDLKLFRKRAVKLEKLEIAIELLLQDQPLPHAFRPHKLIGQWVGLWE